MGNKLTVNLDALIPREDFSSGVAGGGDQEISFLHLESQMFIGTLRKPDFQRETAYWTPQKVADVIRCFLDNDLIPAVILWQALPYTFVVDGAHRLSAFLAWIKDDYGAGTISREFMGGHVPPEQEKAAKLTRELIQNSVGSYAQYKNAVAIEKLDQQFQIRHASLTSRKINTQWVRAAHAQGAQESFFKINDSAQPLDETERQIIKSRASATAIASRAISNSGSGHRYWQSFPESVGVEIERLGKEIYSTLFKPPAPDGTIKSLDLPIAGQGYSKLPFIFALVNIANGVTKATSDVQPDNDGGITVERMKLVKKLVDKLSGDSNGSLGLHPAVYFYDKTGNFKAGSFLSVAMFIGELSKEGKLLEFTKIRRKFEDFLLFNKRALSKISNKYGGKHRNLPPMIRFYKEVMRLALEGKSSNEILATMLASDDHKHIVFDSEPIEKGGPGKPFKTPTKSATYIDMAMKGVVRCAICGGALHVNSLNVDHKDDVKAGGSSAQENAQLTHYFCNSSKDALKSI